MNSHHFLVSVHFSLKLAFCLILGQFVFKIVESHFLKYSNFGISIFSYLFNNVNFFNSNHFLINMELTLNHQIFRVHELQKHIKFPLLFLPVTKSCLAMLTQSHILQYVIQTQKCETCQLHKPSSCLFVRMGYSTRHNIIHIPERVISELYQELIDFKSSQTFYCFFEFFDSEFSIRAMKPQTLLLFKVNFKCYIWKSISKFSFNFNHSLDKLSFNLKIYFPIWTLFSNIKNFILISKTWNSWLNFLTSDFYLSLQHFQDNSMLHSNFNFDIKIWNQTSTLIRTE